MKIKVPWRKQVKNPFTFLRMIILCYFCISLLWFVSSDSLFVGLFSSLELITPWQPIQELFYLLFTGFLLYQLLKFAIQRLERQKKALAKKAERLDNIISSISDYVYVVEVDAEGRWNKSYSSSYVTQLTGYSAGEFLSDWNFWNSLIHPDDKNAALVQLERFKKGQNSEVEYRFKHADGKYRWLRDSASVQRNEKLKGYLIYGVVSDITVRKTVEIQLRQQERLQQGVADAIQHLVTNSDLDLALQLALASLAAATEVHHVYIIKANHGLLTDQQAIPTYRWQWANGAIVIQGNQPSWYAKGSSSFRQKIMEQLYDGEVVSERFCEKEEQNSNNLRLSSPRSLLLLPIKLHQENEEELTYWGSIAFEDYLKERQWSKNELAILRTMTATIGGALKRVESEEALRQNEIRHRAMIDAMPALIFQLSHDGIFLDYKPYSANDLYALSEQQIINYHVKDLLPPDVAELTCFFIERALITGQMQQYEYQLPFPDGLRTYESRLVVSGQNELLAIVRDMTKHRQAEEKIRYQTDYDLLTGLPNRFLFRKCLGQALAHAQEYRQKVGVFMLDLDRFKVINDTLGHSVGDQLLQRTARRLSKSLRERDTVAHLNGDEFGFIIKSLDSEQEALKVAQRILNLLSPAFDIEGHELFITPSIGISFYPADGNDTETLIKNAEVAMYQMKEQGRNGYRLYANVMHATNFEQLYLENSMRQALEREEFMLYYQPLLDLATWQIVGCEALLRWKHPTRGMIPPNLWIPLAEETGLILPIGEWVLRTACQQNKAWQEAGAPTIRVAVNLSARQFQEQNLVEQITSIITESGLSPTLLELEITENIMMQDIERSEKHLCDLKKLGIHFSIDDFGTGYSSLNYLKRFSVDSLKIDRSFVSDVPQDRNDMAIVKAVISLAHNLNLSVIAEGVENEEQLAFLRTHDCDKMQGYFFSRPIPPDEFLALLKSHDSKSQTEKAP